MTPRRMRVLFFALVVLPVAAFLAQASSGCLQLTPEDRASIARDAVRISACQYMTRACKDTAGDDAAAKCWPVYDECMARAGLTDGGGE